MAHLHITKQEDIEPTEETCEAMHHWLANSGGCVPGLAYWDGYGGLYIAGCDDNYHDHNPKFCPFCGRELLDADPD